MAAGCGAPTPSGPCKRSTGGGRCWQHRGEVAVTTTLDDVVPVKVTPWSVDMPATAVTPRTGMILMLQVAWQRWQVYAAMLEDQVSHGTSSTDNGLVGPVWSLNVKDGGLEVTGEQARALVAIEAEERDRFARLAKQAHDMGIDDSEWMAP